LVSDYRYEVPYDFDPISVTGKLHPLTDELFIYLAKPIGSLDPDKEELITTFTMLPNKSRPNEKMEIKNAQSPDFVLFTCTSSTCKEEISIFLKGKVLIILAKRFVETEEDDEVVSNVLTNKRSINLPFPVTLSAFNLERNGEDGFTIKIMKPTSTVKPDAKTEIPIQIGSHYDD